MQVRSNATMLYTIERGGGRRFLDAIKTLFSKLKWSCIVWSSLHLSLISDFYYGSLQPTFREILGYDDFLSFLSMSFKKKMTGNILESAWYNPTECGKIFEVRSWRRWPWMTAGWGPGYNNTNRAHGNWGKLINFMVRKN